METKEFLDVNNIATKKKLDHLSLWQSKLFDCHKNGCHMFLESSQWGFSKTYDTSSRAFKNVWHTCFLTTKNI